MNLYSEHIRLVEAVNNATTQAEHDRADIHLRGWRDGVAAAGGHWSGIDADLHYINQGDERDRCCGVLCDWKPPT